MQEFDLLPDIEKEEIILDCGTFVSTQMLGENLFDTYKLGSFYVQFYYSIDSDGQTSIICYPDCSDVILNGIQLN